MMELMENLNLEYTKCEIFEMTIARGVGQISLAAFVKILFRGKYIILNRRDYFSTSAHK